MEITKYEHACVQLNKGGQKVIIDPGMFVTNLSDLSGIVAVVITHVHPDHFHEDLIRKIQASSPGVAVFGPAEVTGKLTGLTTVTVGPGEEHEAGEFMLKFSGGHHAEIHSSYPLAQNIAVTIDNMFYYAGDSFDKPSGAIKVLAVPAHAPWMKASEAMDYLAAVKPEIAFPTHNSFLSEQGKALMDRLYTSVCETNNITYKSLNSGEKLSF